MLDYSEFFRLVCVYLEQVVAGNATIDNTREVINITPFGYTIDAIDKEDVMCDNIILIMNRFIDEPFIRFKAIICYNDMVYYDHEFTCIEDVFHFIESVENGNIYRSELEVDDDDWDDEEADDELLELGQEFVGYTVLKTIFETVLNICYRSEENSDE